MANDIISDDHSEFYANIRESEKLPLWNLFILAQEVYDRGLQEGWITADQHADFETSKCAAEELQKEGLRRFLSRLSIFFVKNYSIHNSIRTITPEEYVTFAYLLDALSSFTRNELQLGVTALIF